jgi:hypothetical protein
LFCLLLNSLSNLLIFALFSNITVYNISLASTEGLWQKENIKKIKIRKRKMISKRRNP